MFLSELTYGFHAVTLCEVRRKVPISGVSYVRMGARFIELTPKTTPSGWGQITQT